MRDLDGQGVLRQDFILISGDCVGNANLSKVLHEHKERCKEDKNATMTLVYRHALPGHHLRSVKDEVFCVVNENRKILHYARPGMGQSFKVPLEVLEDNIVDLRFDLLDLGIAVCTPAVPPLFADNFDCQTLDEFIKGMLQNDLTDNTFHIFELSGDEYAARITDFHTYFAVQYDFLHRWLYPIVPESMSTEVVYNRFNIYKGRQLDLKHGSQLDQDVLLDSGAKVGANSSLSMAIVGKGTRIGENVSIKNCIIGANVIIGDSCQLTDCALGSDVVLGDNVVVSSRCVLGDEVEILPSTRLDPETWLVSKKIDSGFSDGEDEDVSKDFKLGPKAIPYESEEDDDSDDDVEVNEAKWGGACVDFEENADDESDEDDSDNDLDQLEDAIHNFEIDDDAKFRVFHGEVSESLQRGAKEGVKVDNLVLEVNSSRHAYAVTQGQVVQSVLISIMEISSTPPPSSSSKLLAEVRKCLMQFKELVQKYIKSKSSQSDCLKTLETYSLDNTDFLPIIAKIIHVLYDMDVVCDESITDWFEELDDDSPAKEKVQPLIDWLHDDDDDEDESSEGED